MKLLLCLLGLLVCLGSPALALDVPRAGDGDGKVTVSGERMQWHKVTLTIDGPFAKETDTEPNPFTDYNFVVTFTHASGEPSYSVPGYFAADGNAGETSATQGNQWRAHFSPDKPGTWRYTLSFREGSGAALKGVSDQGEALAKYERQTGEIKIAASDKTGPDLRAHGRLTYVGERYLKFAGSGAYFLKAGADAPETLLTFKDFDGTRANNPKKGPLKTYTPHVGDWHKGDPTWQGGKGKGLIGAINYLSATGCNAFSFLTYNAGGDGDNVWPFIERNKKLHYDCSKLDQWQTVFEHATAKGMYLHFKLQETENDDRKGKNADGVAAALDGGELGPQRRLYLREIIARFGHNLALNWNLGEENTQSSDQQRDMAGYLRAIDPYDHNIVIHSYPSQQDKVYTPLLGKKSELTGASLQNNWDVAHRQTLKWVKASAKAGKPWVVCNDEQGSAHAGAPPDPGYQGFKGKDKRGKSVHSLHDIRKNVLWGNLMAGGAGVEYYFGYQLPENDLLCEDWRSRDQTWRYSAIALRFFKDNAIPFWAMTNRNDLINADPKKNEGYCLAKPGEVYLVYLPEGKPRPIQLADQKGEFEVRWFNPREGGTLQRGSRSTIEAGQAVSIGSPPDGDGDWLAVIRRTAD